MQGEVKVSILVPIYNHDTKLVRKCLESMRAQTLKECEFIVIDNGAIPEAKDVIAELTKNDNRFRIIRFSENVGYSRAMNTALDAAEGEYIGIVESDDFIDPNFYKELYALAIEKDVDILKSIFYEQRGDSVRVRCYFPPEKMGVRFNYCDFPEFVLSHASTWSSIYKLSMIRDRHISYEGRGGSVGQDIAFLLKVFVSANGIYIHNKAYYHYNVANANSSMKNMNQNLEIRNLIAQYRALEDWWKSQNGTIPRKATSIFGKRFLFNILGIIRKYKTLNLLNKLRVKRYLSSISDFSFFSDAEIREYKKLVQMCSIWRRIR